MVRRSDYGSLQAIVIQAGYVPLVVKEYVIRVSSTGT